MAITFHYKSMKRPNGSIVKTPSIPITLIGKNSVDFVALLDSGADLCVIDRSVAELLGLNLDGEKTQSIGIGGTVNCVKAEVQIKVNGGHETHQFRVPYSLLWIRAK